MLPPISLIFMPGVISAYEALCAALRHQSVYSNECFSCFQSWTKYKRAVMFGTIYYLLISITWYMLVLPCVVFLAATMFAIPIYLEHPQVGMWGAYKHSALLVRFHSMGLPLTFVLYFFFNFILIGSQVYHERLINVLRILHILFLITFPTGIVSIIVGYHHLIGVNGIRRDLYFEDAQPPNQEENGNNEGNVVNGDENQENDRN